MTYRFPKKRAVAVFNVASLSPDFWMQSSDDSTVTLNVADASDVADKSSGSGNNLSQGIAADQPLYNLASLNGRNSLDFDGVSEFMNLDSVLLNSGDFSLFFIIDIPSTITTISALEIFMARTIATQPRGSVNFGAANPSTPDATLAVFHLDTTAFPPSSYIKDDIVAGVRVIGINLLSGVPTFSIDGAEKTVFAGTHGHLDAFPNIERLCQTRDGSNFPFTGKVMEIFYRSSGLSPGDKLDLTNYLLSQAGI